MQYDRDRSGTVEPHELHAALSAFGKALSVCDTLYVGLCSDIKNNSPCLVYQLPLTPIANQK